MAELRVKEWCQARHRQVGTGVADEEGGIRLQKVTCSYGMLQALRDIDLKIADGNGVAVVGPNGAGKTTLLRSVVRAFGVRVSGSIWLDDRDLSKMATHEIARLGVSLVPAERRVFPLSVRDNFRLAIGGGRDWEREVKGFIEFFPFVERLVNRRGDVLSGGEQQAVAIIRGCLAHPRFLLLDEPTEGLAPRAVEGIVGLLLHVRARFGTTFVICERSPELLKDLCLKVVALERGRLVG